MLVREGDSIQGTTIKVLDDPFKWPVYDFNDAGDAAYTSVIEGPIGTRAAFVGDAVLYIEGQQVLGREIMAVSNPVVNDVGDTVVQVGFGDPIGGVINDWVLLGRDSELIVQEGDVIGGKTIESISEATSLNNVGEVVFMARYLEQGEMRRGWFTQHRFLIEFNTSIDNLDVYLLHRPQINDLGDVVFFAAWDTDGDFRLLCCSPLTAPRLRFAPMLTQQLVLDVAMPRLVSTPAPMIPMVIR